MSPSRIPRLEDDDTEHHLYARRHSRMPLVEEQALLEEDDEYFQTIEGFEIPPRDRRRSSVTTRLAAMADMGGPNSIRSFARSWQRAVAFAEVVPRRPSFIYTEDTLRHDPHSSDDSQHDGNSDGRIPISQAGLLSEQLQATSSSSLQNSFPTGGHGVWSQTGNDSSVEDFRVREGKTLDNELGVGAAPTAMSPSRSSIFTVPPHLLSPSIIGSYESRNGLQYGTMESDGQRRGSSLMRRAESEAVEDTTHGEEQPIRVKEVKHGNKVVLTVDGQSTLSQSIFNSINAVVGVGLLSLPLAFKMSGWLLGISILTLTAVVTGYTAGLLGKCMQQDISLITYSDLAYTSFGPRARIVVSALFTLELVAACVALVILFADSLALLLPSVANTTTWKCVCAVLVLILNALPLRLLSYTSIVGIFSTFCIVCIIAFDGIVKKEAPGSLWEPAVTHLLPSNWLSLPLAYGLMASPWGAHSVFPSVYRDMRHPQKWNKAVKVTFSFSYILDICLAVVGILMFGDNIRDAITSNILKTEGYSKSLTLILCACVAVIPLTKIPLSARPLVTTADILCGIHYDHAYDFTSSERPNWVMSSIRGLTRVFVVLLLLSISIIFPAFDSVCAFLGAALCTLISVVLPISFYLKLYWKDIGITERIIAGLLLVLFSIFGLVGTIWTFLPKELIGA